MTPAQLLVLKACSNWSAPYEVMFRVGIGYTAAVRVLSSLLKQGFVEYRQSRDTYRITSAGRRAVLHQENWEV